MGQSADAPQSLNANQLAQDQRRENTRAANQNVAYNRLNQTDQFGNSLQFQRSGTDSRGNPIYSANQSLGAAGKQTMAGMGGLAQQYYSGVSDMMSNPMNVSQEVEDKIYGLGASRVDPRIARDRAALETRLANQGISVGSEAYTNAMGDFQQGANDAYNSLAMQARGQAYGEAMGQRQQRQNELSGLAGLGARFMGQTTNPQFTNYNSVNVPGVNTTALQQMQYNQDYQNYQNQQSQQNAMWGGLAGLGGTILSAPMTGGTSVAGSLMSGLKSYF